MTFTQTHICEGHHDTILVSVNDSHMTDVHLGHNLILDGDNISDTLFQTIYTNKLANHLVTTYFDINVDKSDTHIRSWKI